MTREQLHAALDAYAKTINNRAKCSTAEVRAISDERDHDVTWTTVACVKAALEAAEALR